MKKILGITFIILFLLSCSSEREDLGFKEKALKGEDIKILALGDSVTYGYKVKPDKSYPSQLEKKLQDNGYNYSIENFGINGNTSSDLLNRVDNILENNQADIIILCIGGNDGLKKRSLLDMQVNIEKIIKKIEEKNIHIVFVGMELPVLFGWEYSSNFGETFESIAEDTKLDFYPYLLDGLGISIDYNQSDNIHPTALGYTIISNNLYDFLEDRQLLYKKKIAEG